MIVLRVERDGEGMYSSGLWHVATSDANGERHPVPDDDSLLVRNRPRNVECTELYYGFANPVQLRRWIYSDDWLTAMHTAGGYLAMYEVPAEYVGVGRTQVEFVMAQAKRVGTCSLDPEYLDSALEQYYVV